MVDYDALVKLADTASREAMPGGGRRTVVIDFQEGGEVTVGVLGESRVGRLPRVSLVGRNRYEVVPVQEMLPDVADTDR